MPSYYKASIVRDLQAQYQVVKAKNREYTDKLHEEQLEIQKLEDEWEKKNSSGIDTCPIATSSPKIEQES